ncbi:MAG: putative capsular polysaccharide synthesis family protein [Acidimicrobiales bacterium]
MSQFFHDFRRFVGVAPDRSTHTLDQLRRCFLDNERLLDESPWFGREFEPALGIDVFARPFPIDAGYDRFAVGAGEILLLRLELDDRDKERVIGDFLGEPAFRLG